MAPSHSSFPRRRGSRIRQAHVQLPLYRPARARLGSCPRRTLRARPVRAHPARQLRLRLLARGQHAWNPAGPDAQRGGRRGAVEERQAAGGAYIDHGDGGG